MKKLTIAFICIFAGFVVIYAQHSTARVENLRTRMTGKSMIVRYDIVNSSFDSLHRIDFVVVDNKRNAIYPDSVSGDTGSLVSEGKDKKIVWDIYKEFDVVYGDFTPKLIIDAADNRKHSHGPEYAALSLLLPGLGDYFVADSKQLRIKPYYKTAFTAGILGLSWAAYRNRLAIPAVISPPGYYVSADAPPGERYKYFPDGYLVEPASTEYWLFWKDAEIILGIGIASWLFDVIWVARKGVVNNRIYHSVLDHLALIPAKQGLLLSYRIQFE
jgi:hypothetical protein